MAIKKGLNHSNYKERCSVANLDDTLWKYCKSRYTDSRCSDVHWKLWRMCNVRRLGSEYQLPISPIWRRRSTNVKKSTAFCTSLRFALRSTVCILPLVRSLRFTLSNGFSIVCLAPLFSCISFFFSALPYFYSTMSVLLSSLLCASLTHSSTVIYNVYFAFFPIWSVGLLPWRKKFRFRYTCDVRLGRLGMPHRTFICNKRRNPL